MPQTHTATRANHPTAAHHNASDTRNAEGKPAARYMSPLNNELISEEEWRDGQYENNFGYVLLAEEHHFRIQAEDVLLMAEECMKRDMCALQKADMIDAFVSSSMGDEFEDGEQEADTRPLKSLLHKALKADKIIVAELQKELDVCCKSMALIAHRPTRTRVPCGKIGLKASGPSLAPPAPRRPR